MNILVTDADFKHTLGIVRHIFQEDYNIYVLSYHKFSLAGLSKYVKKELIIKKNYTYKDLFSLCKINKIELIILVGTNSFKKIVPWKKYLKNDGIDIITVDDDVLNITFSKKETYKLANQIGVPIARTFYPKSIDEVEKYKDIITYPCVIKGLIEVGGNIVDYAYNKDELKDKYIKICKKYNLKNQNELPMLQEYITGKGCAFFAVYNKGKCGLTFQHKRVREYPVSGGASVCAQSYKNELVQKYGKMLLDNLNWHGVAMVEFKLNDKGIPILMEINPKFWGSTDLALEAGVNFPKALIDIYLNKDVKFSSEYKYPFKYHWLFYGDILHALTNHKNIIPIIKDTLNPSVKGNIWLKDFLPTLKMPFDLFLPIVIEIKRKFFS